jgi:hypothetical protein
MELLFETNIVDFRIDDRILVTIDVLQTLDKSVNTLNLVI